MLSGLFNLIFIVLNECLPCGSLSWNIGFLVCLISYLLSEMRACLGELHGEDMFSIDTVAVTENCPSCGEIPNILLLAWGNAFGEVVAIVPVSLCLG